MSDLIVPPPSNPVAVARRFVEDFKTDVQDTVLIRRHRNTWHAYDGRAWPEVEDKKLEAELYRWLENAKFEKTTTNKGTEQLDFEPSRRKMGDLLEALAALTHLDASITPPTWFGTGPDVVPVANGLLQLEARELRMHTPSYFCEHVLPFDYDAAAPPPARWLAFLEELWEDDVASIQTLSEMFGYVLAGGTALQKMFVLVGPKRSGKGTIGRVLTGLLGAHNVAAPTLSGMTGNFGLQALIGKPLALISDARLGARTDASIAVERLLSISGEDSITVDRKYRDPWTGRLPTRFLILTNEIPRFADASGALASRFVLLVMTKSFLGREDPGLTDALLGEASGILNWALEGLDRLRERGHFQPPPSANEALLRLEDLASPVNAFVRDRCEIGPAFETSKDDLWAAWKDWCTDEGRDRPGTKAVFGRDLHAAYPSIVDSRPRVGKARITVYQGIGLRVPGDDDGSEEQSPDTLTTHDHPEPVRDPVGVAAPRNGRSAGTVTGGQGSEPMYPPHADELVPGRLVRQLGGLASRRFKVKAVHADCVDAYEIERGDVAGKLRTFAIEDVAVVGADA